MDIRKNLLFVFMWWVVLGSSSVMAQSHNHEDHQHKQTSIASPFDGQKEVVSLHCLLRGHVDRLVCPHSKIDGEQTPIIAKECDGKRSVSIPISNKFFSKFTETNNIVQFDSSLVSKLIHTSFPSFNSFIDSLDPPPKKLL